MAKKYGRRRTILTRPTKGQNAGGLLRRYGPDGTAKATPPRPPSQQRELPLRGTAKKSATGSHTTATRRTSSARASASRPVSSQEVTSAVLAALAGGPLRLAIEDIARQVVWEIEREQQGAMQQGGSYQRLGGF